MIYDIWYRCTCIWYIIYYDIDVPVLHTALYGTYRCTCKLRVTNARTGWTHKTMALDILLNEDVDDDVDLTFPFKPTNCLNEVGLACAAHCQSLGIEIKLFYCYIVIGHLNACLI